MDPLGDKALTTYNGPGWVTTTITPREIPQCAPARARPLTIRPCRISVMSRRGRPRPPEAALSQIGHARSGVALQTRRLREASGDPIHDAEFLLNRAKRLFDLGKEATQAPYRTPHLDRVFSDVNLHSLRDRIKYVRDTSEHWIEYGRGVGARQSYGEAPSSLRVEFAEDKPEIPISYHNTVVSVSEIEGWANKVWAAAKADLT